jgi:hypothetical protein
LEHFSVYQQLRKTQTDIDNQISRDVAGSITSLPWFFRFPIRALANAVGCLSILLTGRLPATLSPSQRGRLVSKARWIPMFSTFHDLVLSLATLRLFDLADGKDGQ